MNEADMNEYNPGNNADTQAKIETVKLENKDLKHEITELNNILKRKEKDSEDTLIKYYDLKKVDERYVKSVFESRSKKLQTL